MKKALLLIVALLCVVMFVASIFGGGRIRLFSLPVSGLLFVVIFREAMKEIER